MSSVKNGEVIKVTRATFGLSDLPLLTEHGLPPPPLIYIPKQLQKSMTLPSSPSPQPSAQGSSQCPGVLFLLPSLKYPVTLQQ